ncbi:hypothetical protein FBQ82_01940 [Anaerolineae bacterium CFX7]|nr:hypothetical protein [Anaerolineae bacterium CFX7]
MNIFTATDIRALSDAHAADPAFDVARLQARNQLAWLHERIYGEMRARRWDVHFRPEWSLSPAQRSESKPRVDVLRLRYTKAEYVVHLMQKQFGGPALTWDDCAWLGIGLDGQGVFVEWQLSASAQLDAQNFYNKVTQGAPEKRTLRQIFAELSGEGALELSAQGQRVLHVRCARLVDLNVLNDTLEKFTPGQHAWRVVTRVAVADPRLQINVAPDELLYRLAQLYALHQFAAWAPRNNFLARARGESNSGIAP